MNAARCTKFALGQMIGPLIEPLESRTLFASVPAAVATPITASHAQTAAKVSVQPSQPTAMPLSSVHTFSYVLADLAGSPQISEMAQSSYDMLIVDPNATYKGNADFNMKGMVAQLHAGDPGRVVLAYLDIGEAATDRTYWQPGWKAPTKRHHGSPSFILERDPFGWNGSYPVAYWTRAWQNLFLGPNGIVKRVMQAGFDGVFLDWVGAYQDPVVAADARSAGIGPAAAMVNFIGRIRAVAKSVNPAADVVGLNGVGLAAVDPQYLKVVDAIAAEGTWFSGTPNAPWGDPAGGDTATDPSVTADDIESDQVYQSAGKPVFTVDYALDSADVDYAYSQSSDLGFVPLVTQVSLAQPTDTPPP